MSFSHSTVKGKVLFCDPLPILFLLFPRLFDPPIFFLHTTYVLDYFGLWPCLDEFCPTHFIVVTEQMKPIYCYVNECIYMLWVRQ